MAALDEVDQVMAAIVGAAGLLPTLAAIDAGKDVLLANKRVAGHLRTPLYGGGKTAWGTSFAGR